MNLLIGSYVSMSKPDYLIGSINESISYGSNCFMIYTGAPQNSIRTELSKLNINKFQELLKKNNVDINNVVVHAPYIVNLGSNDKRKHAISTQTLKTEVYRTRQIGCKYLVLHPGNATDCSREQAIVNIVNGINAINKMNHDVIICLETMSGKGSEIGTNFKELSDIINKVNNKSLIGVCLDTCHINDAGYKNNDIDFVLKNFNDTIGLKYLKVIHLNDSKNDINSHKDRHENIGYGTIGFNNLLKWAYDKRLENVPKILETPWFNNKPMYKLEIECIKNKKWKDYRK